LVAVGSGAAKLVSMPVENYRKDRRVLKGMQRGKRIELIYECPNHKIWVPSSWKPKHLLIFGCFGI
jgi:hypothetical protein